MEKFNQNYMLHSTSPIMKRAGEDIRNAQLTIKRAVMAFRESLEMYESSGELKRLG